MYISIKTICNLYPGNECSGVSGELMDQCDHMLAIPPSSPHTKSVDSLNVSVATG